MKRFFFTLILLITPSMSFAASQVCDGKSCVDVEVVSKLDDMERGLMYRTSLGADNGMLFAFSAEAKQQFWMKNMHFNLDMLWIDANKKIVYIGHDIPACTNDPCPIYAPEVMAQYVLELNTGYTNAHQWKLGDILSLGLPLSAADRVSNVQ